MICTAAVHLGCVDQEHIGELGFSVLSLHRSRHAERPDGAQNQETATAKPESRISDPGAMF